MNINGPYPGRQLFLGMTLDNRPAFAYLVTGRSPLSRERKAIFQENKVIIGPLSVQQYDPLRHYTAVEFDNASGIVVVSNGIQTEAVFETFLLAFRTGFSPAEDFLEKLLESAGAEPDSINTPRIVGIVTSQKSSPVFILGIKRHDMLAKTFKIRPEPGNLIGLSTYSGDMKNPKPFDPSLSLLTLEFEVGTPEELGNHLFDISAVSYEGGDIRVCSIGGIYLGGEWKLAIRNSHGE
jgi:IMP cyclohydrolase